MTACPICGTDFTPRRAIQKYCTITCTNRKRDTDRSEKLRTATAKRKAELYAEKRKAAEDKQKRGAAPRNSNQKHYIITDTLPRDLDLLWVQFTVSELDEALEDHSLPEASQLSCSGVTYEVFDSLAGNGKTYQRLQGDNGKVIMSKAERRISV